MFTDLHPAPAQSRPFAFRDAPAPIQSLSHKLTHFPATLPFANFLRKIKKNRVFELFLLYIYRINQRWAKFNQVIYFHDRTIIDKQVAKRCTNIRIIPISLRTLKRRAKFIVRNIRFYIFSV